MRSCLAKVLAFMMTRSEKRAPQTISRSAWLTAVALVRVPCMPSMPMYCRLPAG